MKYAVVVVLACVLGAQAQFVKVPAKLDVPPGRLVPLAVEWEGTDFKFTTSSPDIDVIREYDPDPKKVRLRVMAYNKGNYRLFFIASKNGKMSEFSTVEVNSGGVVPPGPTPPNPPVPPEPTPPQPLSPLAASFKKAIGSDPQNIAYAKAMSIVYEKADALLDGKHEKSGEYKYRTTTQLFPALVAVVEAVVPKGKVPELRVLISEELKKVFPDDPDVVLEDRHRQSGKSKFAEIAQALSEATK